MEKFSFLSSAGLVRSASVKQARLSQRTSNFPPFSSVVYSTSKLRSAGKKYQPQNRSKLNELCLMSKIFYLILTCLSYPGPAVIENFSVSDVRAERNVSSQLINKDVSAMSALILVLVDASTLLILHRSVVPTVLRLKSRHPRGFFNELILKVHFLSIVNDLQT